MPAIINQASRLNQVERWAIFCQSIRTKPNNAPRLITASAIPTVGPQGNKSQHPIRRPAKNRIRRQSCSYSCHHIRLHADKTWQALLHRLKFYPAAEYLSRIAAKALLIEWLNDRPCGKYCCRFSPTPPRFQPKHRAPDTQGFNERYVQRLPACSTTAVPDHSMYRPCLQP